MIGYLSLGCLQRVPINQSVITVLSGDDVLFGHSPLSTPDGVMQVNQYANFPAGSWLLSVSSSTVKVEEPSGA